LVAPKTKLAIVRLINTHSRVYPPVALFAILGLVGGRCAVFKMLDDSRLGMKANGANTVCVEAVIAYLLSLAAFATKADKSGAMNTNVGVVYVVNMDGDHGVCSS
jgi:hypothetical protein